MLGSKKEEFISKGFEFPFGDTSFRTTRSISIFQPEDLRNGYAVTDFPFIEGAGEGPYHAMLMVVQTLKSEYDSIEKTGNSRHSTISGFSGFLSGLFEEVEED